MFPKKCLCFMVFNKRKTTRTKKQGAAPHFFLGIGSQIDVPQYRGLHMCTEEITTLTHHTWLRIIGDPESRSTNNRDGLFQRGTRSWRERYDACGNPQSQPPRDSKICTLWTPMTFLWFSKDIKEQFRKWMWEGTERSWRKNLLLLPSSHD